MACFCISLGAVALADDLPDSATLRGKSAAAYGATVPNSSETIVSSNPSFSTTRHSYRRGSDSREVVDAGPVHTESGVAHGERWHQDDNGHTVIELPDRVPPGVEPTTTTVTRVHTPPDRPAQCRPDRFRDVR